MHITNRNLLYLFMEDISLKRKFYITLLICALIISCFSGCSSSDNKLGKNEDTIHIVTTIFPEYDWVNNILGDNPAKADVTLLLDNGVDLHSYQPTAEDIIKISTCDLFIYVGGESDKWVDDVLKEAKNKDMIVVNLLDTLGDSVKEEELVEGMEGEEEEEGEDEDEEEGPEYDEHVWLSLKNFSILVNSIDEAIEKLDKDNASTYQQNAKAYTDKLNKLDNEYKEVVDNASIKTLLFGDRFPFRYLTEDYNLDYYAAFIGCSAETEASFDTITFLAQKVDELSLKNVITIEGTNHKIAETIIQNTKDKNQQILKDYENGTNYLSTMEKNLEVLKEALK